MIVSCSFKCCCHCVMKWFNTFDRRRTSNLSTLYLQLTLRPYTAINKYPSLQGDSIVHIRVLQTCDFTSSTYRSIRAPCARAFLLSCSYLESRATIALTTSSPVLFFSPSAQSLRVSPTYRSSLGIFCLSAASSKKERKEKQPETFLRKNKKQNSIEHYHSFFIFFFRTIKIV